MWGMYGVIANLSAVDVGREQGRIERVISDLGLDQIRSIHKSSSGFRNIQCVLMESSVTHASISKKIAVDNGTRK